MRSCGDDHYLYQENMHSPAGKFSKVEILSTSSSAILGLRGFYIDAIEEVGDTQYIAHTEDISNVNIIMEVVQMHLHLFSSIKRLWSTSLSKSSKAYHTCFRQVESLWRAPVGNILNRLGRRDINRQEVMKSRDIMEFVRFENLLRLVVRQSKACLRRPNDSAAAETLRQLVRCVYF